VDTIPLVGEQALADAVRACARLPRMKALVLAGSLMGGDIECAVRVVRAQGLIVVSLNMAGSVLQAADLVVADRKFSVGTPEEQGLLINSSRAATNLGSSYYYPSNSSHAATSSSWGRLATCGGL
jgi:hypothetical protein